MRAVEEKPIKEITARELADWESNGKPFQLIDVREPHEYQIVNIGAELIPLAQVLEKADRIDSEIPVIIHCKSGGRSSQAIRQLELERGFKNLYNLKGGILAYIDEVKPELTKY
jgi:adenylyltransferase/sulfurtransferase